MDYNIFHHHIDIVIYEVLFFSHGNNEVGRNIEEALHYAVSHEPQSHFNNQYAFTGDNYMHLKI
jgi:hypothetical protein